MGQPRKIVIVRTAKGDLYGNFLRKELNLRGLETHQVPGRRLEPLLRSGPVDPETTVVHFRTQERSAPELAGVAEGLGFRCVNRSEVLALLIDPARLVRMLSEIGFELPTTEIVARSDAAEAVRGRVRDVVVKPPSGRDQGAYCFRTGPDDPRLQSKIDSVPGERIQVQDLVQVVRIYRVVVLGDRALEEAVFVDEPTAERWKASVSLNPEMRHETDPPAGLLEYAIRVGRAAGVDLGFVDVWETPEGYVLGALDSACSLVLHERLSGVDIASAIASHLASIAPGARAGTAARIAPGVVVEPVEGLHAYEVEDELVVYHEERGRGFFFNSTAHLVWRLCDGERSVGEISTLLREAYPRAEELERDVEVALERFLREDLLQAQTGSTG